MRIDACVACSVGEGALDDEVDEDEAGDPEEPLDDDEKVDDRHAEMNSSGASFALDQTRLCCTLLGWSMLRLRIAPKACGDRLPAPRQCHHV